MRIGLLVAMALATSATSAPARETPAAAAALAASEALITKANATGIFKAGAWEFGPMALHERSGMRCMFAMDVPNVISVNDPEPTRGNDVGCTTIIGGAIVSHFASHTSLVGSFEGVSAGALAVFKAHVGQTSPYTGEVFNFDSAQTPPARVERLVRVKDGMKLYERIAVMGVGQWIITQRVTAPEAAGPAIDRLATIQLAGIAKEMSAKRGGRSSGP